ncbi:hypothetical protein HDV01_002882 [Terramyces sp. JEL0728]|nr:hypothetical protein HDV01_002882 [Terramyces sp. JEL0728]
MGKLNISHHKSWHVYSKDNINKVKADEKKAAEEEQLRQDRILKADQEAKKKLLRDNAGLRTEEKVQRVHLFEEEEKLHGFEKAIDDKQLDQKVKEDKHTWFLGETRDGKKDTPWYAEKDYGKELREKAADPAKMYIITDSRKRREKSEKRRKEREDPIKLLGKIIRKEKKSVQKKTVEQMRQERLEREEAERIRTRQHLNPNHNRHTADSGYYNSQFNPDIVMRKPENPWKR